MVKPVRRLSGLFVFAAALVALPATAAETLKLPGLKAPVKVAMDNTGVWHIKGQNELDVLRAQGYLVAKYRLFQMDVFRRSALGTRAELFGKGKLEDDWNAKKLLVEQVAPRIIAMMDKGAVAALQAYADGANAFINSPAAAALAEYKKLGVKPQPWKATDTIAIGRAMSWSLSGGMPEEMLLGVLRQMIGAKKFDELAPSEGLAPITITKKFKQPPSVAGLEEDILRLYQSDILTSTWTGLGEKVGSNNWVVSGARTANGKPLLANDPHLGLDVPPIWVQVHLTAPGLNVAGVSFAGTPGVVIGHNDHLGWGVTTTGYDVTDGYIMKLNPANPKQYKFGNEWREFKEIPVTLKYLEGGKMLEQKKTLRLSHFGPVMLERDSGVSMGKTVVFRWTGHDPSAEIATFWGMNHARNLTEFKQALSHFKTGAQNFIYLDREGNIFYHAHADVPLHKPGIVPYVPQDGSDPDQQWQGYIPYDELPRLENPQQGYVVTANNRPAPMNYKYYIGRLFDGGSRARRITDLVLATPKHTPDTFKAMQMDNKVIMQERFLPRFLAAMQGVALTDSKQIAALEQLKKWDGHTHLNSLGPFVYFKWLKHLNLLALGDELSGDLVKRAYDHIEVIGDILDRHFRGVAMRPWFDIKNTPQTETVEDIARLAFPLAVAECAKVLGDDPAKWTWDRIHQITLSHDLGAPWSRGPMPGPGAYGTVNNAGFGFMGERMDYGGGPSVRLVMTPGAKGIDMWATLPGADIADWQSKDAVDLLPNWMAGKYHVFDSDPARADSPKDNKRTLVFKP